MYYVYLLNSTIDKSPYIGQTDNLNNRLLRHNAGRVVSTKSKRPWIVVKFEEYPTRSESMWREHVLKTNATERKKFYEV